MGDARIQPIGDHPIDFSASSSYVYGVDAFLLTGAEVEKMSAGTKPHR